MCVDDSSGYMTIRVYYARQDKRVERENYGY